MMLTTTMAAWADVVEVNGLRYDVSTGTVPLTASVIAPAEGVYTGEITIPSSINFNGEDIIVDFIKSDAFANATITKVTIPSTVYFIGARAFYHCENLSEITLPEGLREISVSVFAGCPFTSLTLPGTLTRIDSYGLEGLSSLQKLTLAYSEEKLSMDGSVFNGTNNIIELVIDRDYSFGNNTSISTNTVKKVTFGEHVTKIPEYACYDMTLEELNISANVTAIGKSAFMGCTLPEGYNFPFAQIKEIEDGGFYVCKNLPANIDLSGVETIGGMAFNSSNVQTVKLGSNLTTFGEQAFQQCSSLTTINIPGTINSLESWWFYGCNALTNVTFDYGSTALTLEDGTFSYATNLTIDRTISGTTPFSTSAVKKVALGSHMNSTSAIQSLNLSQYTGLTELELLEGFTTVPEGVFKNLATVTTLILPEGLEKIFANAFEAIGISALTIPGTLKTIDRAAFKNCPNLASVTLDDGGWNSGTGVLTFNGTTFIDSPVTDFVANRPFTISSSSSAPFAALKRATFGPHVTSIPAYMFSGVTLEQLVFSENVTEVGNYAFKNCTVSAINLPDGLETIGQGAFNACTATINGVPSTVTSIGQSAFSGCTGLTGALVVPAGVTQLGGSTFSGTGITSVTIPGTVTIISQSDFGNCANLTSVTLLSGENKLTIGKRCFYNSNNITDVTIDRNFTYYNDLEKNRSPFNTAVERVTFGSNVTRVGDRALASCQNLTDVVLPDNITTVGVEAFKWSKPQTLTLSKNLTTVEDYGFYGMIGSALPTLTLPMNMSAVGKQAYYDIPNLTGVYVPWIDPLFALANDTESEKTFSYATNQTLWIPGGTLAKYQAADGWKRFQNFDYWSFVVNTSVKGKGALAWSNGETVTDNGTNTAKSLTGTALATEAAAGPVSGLFAREKDVTFTATPARGYELSGFTANGTAKDVTAGNDPSSVVVSSLTADQTIVATFTPIIYNITYNNLQNGVVDPANPATYTVEDNAITLVNPTRTAYNFKGWTGTDLTEATMTVVIPASSIGDREYTATWEPIVYDITYDLAGGAVDPANLEKYTIETADFTLTNPTKLGYTFLGWEGTDLSEKTMTVTVTTGHWGDRSYTATWEPNPYKVRFDINGGDGTETMADQDHVYDAPLNLTQNAFTRTGYTFKEWNSKADGTGTVYADKAEVANLTAVRDEVVTIYAQWTPNPYKVRFNANNGTGTMANQDFVYDTQQALTENAFTRTGYTFKQWTANADGTGASYADKASVKNLTAELNGVFDLYAQWQVIIYDITYDLAGGEMPTGVTNPAQYNIESANFTLTNPTRTGYIFAGWTGTGLSAATQTVTVATGSYGNRAYTATWTPIHYTMKFDANEGTGSMTDQLYTYDVEMALKANAFTRSGYNFKNWNTKADGSGTTYTNQQSLLNLTATDGASFTLYAQWQIIPYIIGYDLAGGTVATANPTEYNVETATFTLTNPTREGYEFTGWEGTGITGTSTTVTIAKGSVGDRAYTATWTPIVYAISYDLADGTVATANPTSYTIETPTFTLTNPTKAHWIFKGWTGTGLSAAAQTVTITKGSIGVRSYTATWERETYTVSVTSNLANMVTASTTSPKYEDDVVLTIADNDDYDLVSLTVDGVDVTSQISGGQYTISSVSANVAVVATYNANKAFITMAHAQQTFSCTQALDFTGVTGLKAYIASGYIDGTVVLTRVDKVPASTGLFLVGTEGAEYKVPFAASSAFYSNLLKPVLTAQTVPSEADGYTNFLYSEVNGVKGFYKSSGNGTVAAGKAYLQLPTSALSNGVKAISFTFEGDETAIDAVGSQWQERTAVYDMAGRKVADTFEPKKLPQGVYIVNGKKVAIK